MQEIAIALHSGKIGAQYGRKEATRQEILPIVSRLLQKFDIRDADPQSLFEKLTSRSGVIVAVERYSERYAFSHLTFQEFYAAAHLFANGMDPFDATNVTADETSFGMTSWWSEVFALYGAMRRQSSDIVARLIDTANEDRSGKRLRLAAQCMAESVEVNAEVSGRLLGALYQVRFGPKAASGALVGLRRYLLRFASQPQFFARYMDWKCNSVTNAEEAARLLHFQCEGVRVGDTVLQSAAMQGMVQIWRKWKIGSSEVNEALVDLLTSTTPDLQLGGISLSIDLHKEGVLNERVRKAAIGAFVDLADLVSRRSERLEAVEIGRDVRNIRMLHFVALTPGDPTRKFAGVATSVTRMLVPGEREAVRERLWKIVTAPPSMPPGEFYIDGGLGLARGLAWRATNTRLVIAACLISICSPEEIAEIRSDLGRGLSMGTGGDQAALLRLLYAMFRPQSFALDQVLSGLSSPLAAVRKSAVLCLLDESPEESRARIRQAVRLWVTKRRAIGDRLRRWTRRWGPSYEKRKANLGDDEALAIRWLLEDALPGVESPEQVLFDEPSAANGEIDAILEGGGSSLGDIIRKRVLSAIAAPMLNGRSARLLTAFMPYLTHEERERALELVKRTCESPKDDEVLSEALASARVPGLPLWPDDAFRQALAITVDHRRWAIADLAAELIASEPAST